LTGVIVEVELQCVPHFFLEKKQIVLNGNELYQNIGSLISQNDHLKIFTFFPGNDCVVVAYTWNRTSKKAQIKDYFAYWIDVIGTAHLFSKASLISFFNWQKGIYYLGRLLKNKTSVLPSEKAFLHFLLPSHYELERAFPNRSPEFLQSFMEKFRKIYKKYNNYPFSFLELRFTSPHHNGFISPGGHNEVFWADLICDEVKGWELLFKEMVQLAVESQAKPHMGKYLDGFEQDYLEKVYGQHLIQFKQIIAKCDPNQKFVSPLLSKILKL
jgi:hypothetical protein